MDTIIPTPDESGVRLTSHAFEVRVRGDTVSAHADILDAIDASKAIGHIAGARVIRVSDGLVMQRSVPDPSGMILGLAERLAS